MSLSSRFSEKTVIIVAFMLFVTGLFAYFMYQQTVLTIETSLRSFIATKDVNTRDQHPAPAPYETEDLFYHDHLVGREMADPAVVRAAKEALIHPSDGPLFLDDPRVKFYSQLKQDEHVKKIFNGKRGGFFLEVGALTGEFMSNTLYLERVLGWTGVLMEPTPISYHVLKSKNRKSYLMRACLGTESSYTQPAFDIGRKPLGSSLLDAEKSQTTIKVPCYPLYSVLAALGNPVVDYMSLDVEGVEMKVLQSIPWHLVKIRVMTIEIFLLPEGPDAVRAFMEDKGFKFIKKLGHDFLFINSQLSEGLNMNV